MSDYQNLPKKSEFEAVGNLGNLAGLTTSCPRDRQLLITQLQTLVAEERRLCESIKNIQESTEVQNMSNEAKVRARAFKFEMPEPINRGNRNHNRNLNKNLMQAGDSGLLDNMLESRYSDMPYDSRGSYDSRSGSCYTSDSDYTRRHHRDSRDSQSYSQSYTPSYSQSYSRSYSRSSDYSGSVYSQGQSLSDSGRSGSDSRVGYTSSS